MIGGFGGPGGPGGFGGRGGIPRDETPARIDLPTRQVFAWLLAAIGKAGVVQVAVLCALQGVSALFGVCQAPVLQRAVDAACAGQGRQFTLMFAALVGIIVLQVALGVVTRWLRELARATCDNRLRGRTFSGVLSLPARQADKQHSAALVSRMTSDVSVVTDGLTGLAPTALSSVIRLVGVLVVMFFIEPALAGVMLVGGACAVAASAALRGVLKRRHRAVQEAESNMRVFMQECLESLIVVHAFGVEDKMRRTNDRNMAEHKRLRLRKNLVANLGTTGLVGVVQLGYVLGVGWCGYGIVAGTMTYGMLTAVIQLVGQLQAPLTSMGGMFSRYTSMLASTERLIEVAEPQAGDEDAAPSEDEEAPETGELSRIAFEEVSFRYDEERPVLDGFSLQVQAGSFVAVAGPSGVGKSTFMKLLLDVYEPDAGAVRLVGADGSSWSPAQAPAGTFAYVPQGNKLMTGTIRQAVSFSDPDDDVDEERLERACRVACADEFIAALPDGYDTVLGERGSGLSEGQTQRLAVARAVFSNAPVLLLDEATSALDSATERRMLGNLREQPGRTVVVVTHRPEAMALCDRVVRVEEGGRTSCEEPRG